jgi:hypothetical protein
MSSERDSFAKGIFSTFAKGFLLHKLLLKVNYSPLRVKKSRSHDMGQCVPEKMITLGSGAAVGHISKDDVKCWHSPPGIYIGLA